MERKREFDYAKAIGIMLVVLGHMTTYPSIIRSAIYSFHMPLFFVVSGSLLWNKIFDMDFGTYVKKKVVTILFPAFFFECLMYVWVVVKNLLEHELTGIQLLKRFLGIFIQIGYSDYTGSLWFLFTFFVVNILLFYLLRIDRKYLSVLAFVMILVSYGYTYAFPHVFLPWHLEIVPACCGYVLFGVVFAEKIKHLGGLARGGCVLWGGWLILWIINYKNLQNNYALDAHQFGNVFLDTLIAMLGAYAVIAFCESLSRREIPILVYVGKNSMVYYSVQAIGVGISNTLIRYFISKDVLDGVWGVVISLIAMVVLIILISFFTEVYLRFIYPKICKMANYIFKI